MSARPGREPARAEYRHHHAAGIEKIRAGEHHLALGHFEKAMALARQTGDPRLLHEAQANLSMVYIQMGEDRKAEAGLREILLNSRDPKVLFGAAYNLAVSLRKQGRYGRALFYARRAMGSAGRVRNASLRAACHNLLGNILLNQVQLDAALDEYRLALRIRRRQREDVRFSIAILLENIGYTYLLKKHLKRGLGLIQRSLEMAQAIGSKRSLAEGFQDVCFAKMRLGLYAEATEAGERALALAQEQGYADVEKNCRYLLGETAQLDDRLEERDRHFDALQRFYPEMPFLREFLCSFDLSDIITLKS